MPARSTASIASAKTIYDVPFSFSAVINPALDDDDFDAAVCTTQAEYDQHKPNGLSAVPVVARSP